MAKKLSADDIKKSFSSMACNEKKTINIDHIRSVFTIIAHEINETCPDSREKSVALTNLETSAMWAIKSISHNEEG